MRVSQSNPPNSRTLQKSLETTESSGVLHLINRRLKEIGELVFKYDFTNVTVVDLSRNRLSEIPPEIFDWQCLSSLTLSHNLIKAIPECIVELKLLKSLNLSNNHLTVLPTQICELQYLTIVKLSCNKLISLPEEIGKLKNCQELDVSVNELTSLPKQIAQMSSLLYLNVRRNNLHALPEEMSEMELTHLNAGCNVITTLPVSFQNITTLLRLVLDNNPLSSPRLPILRKGQVHLFRELEIQAERAQIKKDVMGDPVMSPMKRSNSSVRSDVNIMKMKAHALSMTQIESVTDEERLEKAAELSKDRRKASVTTPVPVTTSTININERVNDKRQAQVKTEAKAPTKRQMSAENIPVSAAPRKPKTPPKNLITKERKRSASSGNFERKSSTEALLIHQKLTGFPGYKPNQNGREKTETSQNSNGPQGIDSNAKEKLQEIAKSRQALTPADRNAQHHGKAGSSVSAKKGFMPTAIKPRTNTGRARGSSFNAGGDKDGPFTMRRKTEKLYEELELMESLRQTIEGRVKTQLGDDLPAALSDGVILCHLTNHVRPRSISMIHVPSPAVPKLNLSKRRRNIDSFLDACGKIGVPSTSICSAQDILLEKNISKVATTVNELLKHCPHPLPSPKRQVETPTVKVTASMLTKQQSAV